jgi:RNA polymerase sigma-70 factor (ECF subfamily)
MRRWLARTAEATALRGEEPRNRFARWTARWFAPQPAVPADKFQDDSEPYPRHWRELLEHWPAVDPADPALQARLTAAVDELPATWRAVVIARDVLGRDLAEVSERFGLTPRQQRAILNRARARLRERLDDHLAGEA